MTELADLEPLEPFVETSDDNLHLSEVAPEVGDVAPDLETHLVHVVSDLAQRGPHLLALAAHVSEQTEDGGGQEAENRPRLGFVHDSRVSDAARAVEYPACNYGTALLLGLLFLLGACAGDGPGNDDTLWTGASGLIIAVIALVLVSRWIKRRDRS